MGPPMLLEFPIHNRNHIHDRHLNPFPSSRLARKCPNLLPTEDLIRSHNLSITYTMHDLIGHIRECFMNTTSQRLNVTAIIGRTSWCELGGEV